MSSTIDVRVAPGRFNRIALPQVASHVGTTACGIGDALQGLLVVGSLPRPRYYAVSDGAIPFVELFDGYDYIVRGDGSQSIQINDRLEDYQHEARTHSARPRWDRYRINASASRLTFPHLRDREGVRRCGEKYGGAVLLFPFTHWQNRAWSVYHWQGLVRELRAAGYRPVVFAEHDNDCGPLDCEIVRGDGAKQIAGAMLNCSCVVSNDSGMAHLAGLLCVPSVILCGPTRGEKIFGCYPRATWIQGSLPCDGCYWQSPYSGPRCDPSCADLQTVTPRRVLRSVDDQRLAAITQGRSALSVAKLQTLRREVLRTNALSGDVAEFGVYRGGSAALLRRYMQGGALHLFDTFTGMPQDDVNGAHRQGDFADCLADDVQQFVGDAILHIGMFPETAPPDARYRFAHIDCDIAQSVEAALDYFGPRMSPGGVMVFDDYGWWKCPGVQAAISARYGDVEKGAEYQAIVRIP